MTFPWGDNRRFNSYSNYFTKQFGERVQKISIDAGFSCPNRDGKISTGGCTFCSNEAFNPSYCRPEKSIKQQIEEGIEFHQRRYRRANKYLAYFQPFSNTYKPLEELKSIYEQALEPIDSHFPQFPPRNEMASKGLETPKIVGIVIGQDRIWWTNHFCNTSTRYKRHIM